MQFEIKNRRSGTVQFTAEINCADNASEGVKLGLAVKAGYSSRAYLSGTNLSGAYLSRAVLSGINLSGADLRDADLSDADLSGADLSDAVLSHAILSGTNLSGAYLSDADLSDAVLSEIPLIETIDAQILAAIEHNKKLNRNGLNMAQWHGATCNETSWCNTTHCRAGYAVCMAGKGGFELERRVGTANAAILLYLRSTPDEPIPDFYCSDAAAIADIRARAARQTAILDDLP